MCSSDLVAAMLAHAAARGAGANVIVNAPGIADRDAADRMLREVETRLHRIEGAVARIHQLVRSGALRDPE